jgi:HK97 gp10 family phage protein
MTELVKVEGLRELREALVSKVPQHLQGPTLQKALAAGAKPIVAMAKRLAPVKEGILRRSIFSFRDKGSKPTFEARNIRPRTGKRFQKSGRDAFYWRFVELGHRVGRKGAAGRAQRRAVRRGDAVNVEVVPARPFLRPAFESQKSVALAAIIEKLKVELVIAAKKANWKTSADRGTRSARASGRSITNIAGFFDGL